MHPLPIPPRPSKRELVSTRTPRTPLDAYSKRYLPVRFVQRNAARVKLKNVRTHAGATSFAPCPSSFRLHFFPCKARSKAQGIRYPNAVDVLGKSSTFIRAVVRSCSRLERTRDALGRNQRPVRRGRCGKEGAQVTFAISASGKWDTRSTRRISSRARTLWRDFGVRVFTAFTNVTHVSGDHTNTILRRDILPTSPDATSAPCSFLYMGLPQRRATCYGFRFASGAKMGAC